MTFLKLVAILLLMVGCVHELPEENELYRSGGKTYKLEDLSTNLQYQAFQIEKKRYEDLLEVVSKQILEEDLQTNSELKQKIENADKNISEEDLKGFYKKNKSKIPYAYEVIKKQLKKMYVENKVQELKSTRLEELSKQKNIQLAIRPPVSPVFEISDKGYPVKGDGRVTVVEYADFTCPVCRSAFSKTKDFYERNQDRVRLVYKYFYREGSYQGKRLAKLGYCAHQNKKFWEYSKHVYTNQGKYSKLTTDAVAKEIGMKTDDLKECYRDKNTTKFVEDSMKEAKKLKVVATPSFYLNGMFVSSGDDLSSLERVIQNL